MTDKMRAVEIREPGGPDVLTLVERPIPIPGIGEVLIRVAYAGVNRPDVLQRAGSYAPPPDASDLPGLEAAGHVAALGPGAVGWAEGDAVTALLPGGGYAEYVTAPAAH
ncbi:MAG: alcohol dehydrogenase catalytic domain-containing protein, partial [Boseongicola sp.]